MKLIKSNEIAAQLGLPAAQREWWDVGEGYEVFIMIGSKTCTLGISSAEKDITLEVARLLGINTNPKEITFKAPTDDTELYLALGIDCVSLRYTKPKHYKELLRKIEIIISEHSKKNNLRRI
jgi:hypothetical protein